MFFPISIGALGGTVNCARSPDWPVALQQNVGGTDRLARGVAGTALVVLALAGFAAGRGPPALVGTVAGAGLLFNAATQFCGVNALLGIDTGSRE